LYFEAGYRDLIHEMQNEMLNWLISTTRPGTVLGVSNHGSFDSNQTVVRYNCQINADGKIHPERLLEARTKNYL
jgi:hypothetical protein